MARSDYSEAIQVDGLKPFIGALKDAGANLPRELQKANKSVAEFVVTRAAGTARSTSPQAARAAAALSSSAGQQSATVRLSGEQVPGALGSEYGAGHDVPRQTSRGLVRGWNQFPTWRGAGEQAGYWLWPSIRSGREETEAFYDKAVAHVMAEAFPD